MCRGVCFIYLFSIFFLKKKKKKKKTARKCDGKGKLGHFLDTGKWWPREMGAGFFKLRRGEENVEREVKWFLVLWF